MGRRCGAAAAAAVIALSVAVVPTPANAAPACATPGPIGAAISAVPWAQQAYAPDRLTGIADGTGITVAVIDSGVDANHPQLTGQVASGNDFLSPGGNGTTDCVGHGTAVASIIAAKTAPGVAFRGIAPGVRILPVRVTERQAVDGRVNGTGVDAPTLAKAITWAVDANASVINLSLSTTSDDPALRRAIAKAVEADVVVVAAVGNAHDEGDPTPYPAAYPGVIGVAAVGIDGVRAQDSQVGADVDIAAPGVDVTAAARVRGLAIYGGTSFATPFVAATAALVRQRFRDLSAAQVAERIMATADPSPGGPGSPGYGHGLLDPVRAVTARVDPAPPEALTPLVGQPVTAKPSGPPRWQRQAALTVAGLGLISTLAVVLLATAWPRGRQRRWRIG